MTGSRISTALRSGLLREFVSLNTSAFTNENPRRSARSIASMRAATRFIAGKAKKAREILLDILKREPQHKVALQELEMLK